MPRQKDTAEMKQMKTLHSIARLIKRKLGKDFKVQWEQGNTFIEKNKVVYHYKMYVKAEKETAHIDECVALASMSENLGTFRFKHGIRHPITGPASQILEDALKSDYNMKERFKSFKMLIQTATRNG